MYCKEKWRTAGGKDPLFGHVDGFQIDPKDLFCLNRAQGAEFRHIVHCKVYGEQDDRRFQQGHQQRFDVLLSAQISRAPPNQCQLDKEIALRHCRRKFRKEPGDDRKESGYGAADPGESIGLFFHKDSFLSLGKL